MLEAEQGNIGCLGDSSPSPCTLKASGTKPALWSAAGCDIYSLFHRSWVASNPNATWGFLYVISSCIHMSVFTCILKGYFRDTRAIMRIHRSTKVLASAVCLLFYTLYHMNIWYKCHGLFIGMRPLIKQVIRAAAFELRSTNDNVNSYYKTETNAKHYICIYPFNNHRYFKQVYDKTVSINTCAL